MSSRKDKIFQILKEQNAANDKKIESRRTPFQSGKIKKKENQRPYKTTAEMLQLFDNGNWDLFNQRLNESFKSVTTLKMKKQESSCTAEPLNTSPMLEFTMEELEGMPIETLDNFLENNKNSKNLKQDAHLLKKNAFDDELLSPKEQLNLSDEDSMAEPLSVQKNTRMPTKETNKDSQRKSRTHNCLYCDTLVTNFRRHVYRNHMMEEDVRAIFSETDENLKERKRKRRIMLDNLRKKGNHKFNSKKGAYGESIILPIRRPKTGSDVVCREKYVSCIFCLGTFSKKTFYRHLKKCTKNPKNEVSSQENENQSPSGRKAVLKENSINLITCVDDRLKTRICDTIKKDKFGLIAMNDALIFEIGLQFFSNHREEKDDYNLTKKMRDAAKILNFCQENSGETEIYQFSDLLHPCKFQLVMKAVQHLSKLNSETGIVEVVGMPARLSYVIIEGAKIVLNNAIQNVQITRSEKDEIKTSISEFLELFRNSYKYFISSNAENTRKKQAATKTTVMPDDDDIGVMIKMVKSKEKTMYQKLIKKVEPATYESLCKATICDLLLFNRRRPGELVRAELFNYCNRPQNEQLTEDVQAVMSQDEINSLSMFSVFMVPGKNGRTVPILFTEDIKKNIDLIISCRPLLKIPIENRFLFPRAFSTKTFDGSKILREFTQLCTLKKPEHMTATGLRHHLATKTSLSGKESLTENVCEQLGHTLAIHKKNYRFPIQAIQRGVVANHLLNVNGVKQALQSTVSYNSESTNVAESESSNVAVLLETVEREEDCQFENTAQNEDVDWSANQSAEDDVSSSSEEEVLRKPTKHKKWSEEEKKLVIKSFSTCILAKTTPGKFRCEELIKKSPILQGRSWQQVNAVIYNVNSNKLKIPRGLGLQITK